MGQRAWGRGFQTGFPSPLLFAPCPLPLPPSDARAAAEEEVDEGHEGGEVQEAEGGAGVGEARVAAGPPGGAADGAERVDPGLEGQGRLVEGLAERREAGP